MVDPEDTIVIEEYTTNPTRFVRNLTKLATIVLNKHYSYVRDALTREDLIQEAIYKAIELCNAGTFDATRSSLRNYLYTGMRNQMQNYLAKSKKEICVEDVRNTEAVNRQQQEELEDLDQVNYLTINENILYDVCDPYWAIGNYHNALVRELKRLGFTGELTDLEEPEEIDSFILQTLEVEYFWRFAKEI